MNAHCTARQDSRQLFGNMNHQSRLSLIQLWQQYLLHTCCITRICPTLECKALKVWIVTRQKYQERLTQTMHTLYPFDQISQLREYGGKAGGVEEGLESRGEWWSRLTFYQLIRYKRKYKDKHTLTQIQRQTGRREGGVGCWEGRAVTVGVLSVVVVGPGPSVRHLQ